MFKLRDEITGYISDTHFPGHLQNALEFVLDTGRKFGVTQWVHIGDVLDHHYISRHPTVPDAWNPIEEFHRAKEELQRWVQAIPELYICKNTHDAIPLRRAAEQGMPDLFLKTINEVYDLPDTWVWHDRYLIYNRTIVEHGVGSNGMYGAKNTAKALGSSYVQGHTHAHGAVFDLPRPTGDCAALNVGCLMCPDKYFARYAKHYKIPMSHGMGVTVSDSEMYFVKMGDEWK